MSVSQYSDSSLMNAVNEINDVDGEISNVEINEFVDPLQII